MAFPAGWTLGSLTRVYADGFVDSACATESDEHASLWVFPPGQTYQYIAVQANKSMEITPFNAVTNDCAGTHGDTVWCSFDNEVDAVGAHRFVLGAACSPDEEICKQVTYQDANSNGVVEVGERVYFTETFTVHNPSGSAWASVTVSDNWGAEINVNDPCAATEGNPVLSIIGNSDKEMKWRI